MIKKIYLAGGCFWGVQEYFSRINGVIKTYVGYANSNVENPSYELVCSGTTKAVEAVEIEYENKIVSLEELIDELFKIIDPTLLNRQANDVGTQYRTGIYYVDSKEEIIISEKIKKLQEKYSKPIRTEVMALNNFWLAEEYHQDYLKKNPNGYCHIKFK